MNLCQKREEKQLNLWSNKSVCWRLGAVNYISPVYGCRLGQAAGLLSLLPGHLGRVAATWPETLGLPGHRCPGEDAEDWALEGGGARESLQALGSSGTRCLHPIPGLSCAGASRWMVMIRYWGPGLQWRLVLILYSECECVCVCVCERERERERVRLTHLVMCPHSPLNMVPTAQVNH